MDQQDRRQLEQRLRSKALRGAKAKLGFRWHLMTFLIINVALFALNQAFTPGVMWFVWPLFGWGLALAFHAYATFSGPAIDEDAIEAEVQRELARRSS